VSNALSGSTSGSSILSYKGQPSINVSSSADSQVLDAN
jgi:hypothetical protein